MSLIQIALFDYLKAYTDLTDIVGQNIFPFGAVPTGTELPYVTWQIIDRPHVHNQAGPSGLGNPRFQIDGWADSEYKVAQMGQVIRIALDNYRGSMGDAGNEVIVRHIEIDSDNEQYIPPGDATQKGAFRTSADFLVWNVEEV